jgi:hypothetical protein
MTGLRSFSRQQLLAMPWDELESLGLCECGTPLASHPKLPKVRPLTSWKAQRSIEEGLSQNATKHQSARKRAWNRVV